MSKLFSEIDEQLARFIADQHIFFVATAPLSVRGHVNCSPKGLDSLRILDSHRVAYIDFTGSGIETIAHIRENSRVVLMFCAFQGPPKIVRIHGQGRVIEPDHSEFAATLSSFGREAQPAIRAIIHVTATRISTSCGYAVPLLNFEGERDQLEKWAEHKGKPGLEAYKRESNAKSIDGLTGLPLTVHSENSESG